MQVKGAYVPLEITQAGGTDSIDKGKLQWRQRPGFAILFFLLPYPEFKFFKIFFQWIHCF